MSRRKNILKVNKDGGFYKTVRLNDGRFVTIHLNQSSATDLDKADPTEVWTTGDGRKLLPKDMELKHLLNVRKQLQERTAQAMSFYNIRIDQIDPPSFTAQLWPIFSAIDDEIQYRLGIKERPKNKPAAVLSRRKLDLEL